ncbi:hypothetical protein DRW03_27465 [Corallococcus sp. H22C18031201]|uniref:hypothetical protein n=1 Tax=Citreicoccus inhibens TaxID=2849499 RepID=UPI000E71616E|nr:hypothetical protein [Citreicoccus inhibens]MBU8900330.1 hypothetical protein [Citreicoccus inhibens]RJS17725.1 hypothetical protein DRW03_27465 [Corallococcus sp. H22C18031201]
MMTPRGFMLLGLVVCALGCGGGPPSAQATRSPQVVEAAPAQPRPTDAELALPPSGAPLQAVPVHYAVDPSSSAQRSVSVGRETAGTTKPESAVPGRVRRVLP